MNIGKKIRLSRIMNSKSGKTIIVPMDHHGTSIGPIDGIEDPKTLIKNIVDGGADAILSHIGTFTYGYAELAPKAGSILHMCVSTNIGPNPNYKLIINDIETAISLGVDAVSTQVNLGDDNETQMLQDLGKLSNQCIKWGIPLMAMMYIRGHDKNEKDVELIRHSARIASELGCDIVKVPYTGDIESMKRVVDGTQIPVVIAGGSKIGDEETLKMVKDAMSAGCAGLSMGRNIFERPNPQNFMKKIVEIVHGI